MNMAGEMYLTVSLCMLVAPIDNTNGATLPTTKYGHNWICLNRSEDNECPFHHELGKCTSNYTLVACVPCKDGYLNCERVSSLKDIKCYRQECEPDERSVVKEHSNGGCETRCVCIQEGFVKNDNGDCVEREPCGINMMLEDDRCVNCPAGSYKPRVGDEKCIPYPSPTNQLSPFPQTPGGEQYTSKPPVNQSDAKAPDPSEITVTSVRALSSTEVYVEWKRPGTMYNYTVVYQAEPIDPSAEKKQSVFNKDAIVNTTLQKLLPATSYKAYIIASGSRQIIKSRHFYMKTKENESNDRDDKANVSGWPIAGTIVGILTFLVLIAAIYYWWRKRRPETGVRIPAEPPPPYRENVVNKNESGRVNNEGGHGGNSPPGSRDHNVRPPNQSNSDISTERLLPPGEEMTTFSSVPSNSTISNDPDRTHCKQRRTFDGSDDLSTVQLPQFDSSSTVLPPDSGSERPLVSLEVGQPRQYSSGCPATTNQGQASVDLTNQGQVSLQTEASIHLGNQNARRDSTSSQTRCKRKKEGYIAVPPTAQNDDLHSQYRPQAMKGDNPL